MLYAICRYAYFVCHRKMGREGRGGRKGEIERDKNALQILIIEKWRKIIEIETI